jgi:aspartyl protease family protein
MLNKNFIKFFIIICFSILLVLFLFKLNPERFTDNPWDGKEVASIAILVLISLSAIYSFLNSYGFKVLTNQLLIWCLLFLVIITGYAFRFEINYATQRVLAVLVPSRNWTNEGGQLIISRNSDGHFYVNSIVNGCKIKFMIDTGASDVALTQADAKKLKFDLSERNYTKTYNTANGKSIAAPILLKRLEIGSSLFENIEGHVGMGELDISLLGMSVIERFNSFKIDKDLLILTP